MENESEEIAVLKGIIRDTEDTPDVLLDQAEFAREVANGSLGSHLRPQLLHHFCCVLSRKHQLLSELVARTAALEAANEQREKCPEAAPLYDDVAEFRRYLRRCVQDSVPQAGGPAQLDALCAFFRLPPRHWAVVRGWEVSRQADGRPRFDVNAEVAVDVVV